MATVTATQGGAVRSPGPGGSGSSAGPDTGFGDLLAALVPGSPAGLALATTPPGVCGAGPEVLVSHEDVVVGATDSAPVVVGAAADDTAGSRTGDPGLLGAGVDPGLAGSAAPPTADPAATDDPVPEADRETALDSALLAQARLAAPPLLVAAAIAPAGRTAGRPTDPAGGIAGADALPDDSTEVAPPVESVSGPVADTEASVDPGTDPRADPGADRQPSPPATATPATASTTASATAAAPDAGPAAGALTAAGTPPPSVPLAATRGEGRAADVVPGQVFPEVVRLSQAGPGTHRLTLSLDPGTLGEVRVTLTVRDGEVQVRLAAQHDAREVLALAAPDLRRLLEQSGVEARIAVADLATGATTDRAGQGTDPGTDPGADPGQARHPGSPYGGAERRSPGTPADPEPLPGAERPRATRTGSGLDLAL